MFVEHKFVPVFLRSVLGNIKSFTLGSVTRMHAISDMKQPCRICKNN